MQLATGISLLLLCVFSWVVGIRLVALWRSTRQLPEISLGLLLVLVSGVGFPLMVVARAEQAIGFGMAWLLFALASAAINIGFFMLYLFTWNTFRPDARWGPPLVALAGVALFVNFATNSYNTWLAGSTAVDIATLPLWRQISSIVAVDTAYAWTGVESFLYYSRLRRQRALGLADPVVCNRVLLWGLLSVCVLSALVSNNWATLHEVDVLASPGILLYTSAAGLVQVIFLKLIFLPPQSFVDWIRSRHEAESAPA